MGRSHSWRALLSYQARQLSCKAHARLYRSNSSMLEWALVRLPMMAGAADSCSRPHAHLDGQCCRCSAPADCTSAEQRTCLALCAYARLPLSLVAPAGVLRPPPANRPCAQTFAVACCMLQAKASCASLFWGDYCTSLMDMRHALKAVKRWRTSAVQLPHCGTRAAIGQLSRRKF